MLKLEKQHQNYLRKLGFLDSTISEQLYRSLPTSKTTQYIKRRLIANKLKNMYTLAGIPGFYQEEDWIWNFTSNDGFLVPLFDENNRIQALSIHLDNEFNGISDLWFSSSGRINGTGTKNLVSKDNIQENTETVVITDSLLLGNFMKATLNIPVIAFSSIANSYQILKALDGTNIQKIIFTLRPGANQNLDYIIRRIFRDLLPLRIQFRSKISE